MQFTVLLRLLIRLAPLIALGMVARPLTFHPAPGRALTKTLVHEWKVHLDELDIVFDGVAVSTGITMDTELSQRIVVTDTYIALRGGHPSALDREFKTISQNLEVSLGGSAMRHEWENVTGTSALEGTVVQFRRKNGAYTRRFDPIDRYLDDELLQGLTEDMDLRVLLPDGPVAVGDEWDLDLASLPDLLSPGGYFAWTIEAGGTVRLLSDALDPALMGELRQVLGAILEGHATVKYVAEEDGYSQLAIDIQVEGVKGVDDLSKLAAKIVAEFPDWGTIDVERLDLGLVLQATGTAQWDTTRGQIFDLVLHGDLESTLDLEVAWGFSSSIRIGVHSAATGTFDQTLDSD